MERNTKQKMAVRAVMEKQSYPMTPEEIRTHAYKLVKGISLPTVYRMLRAMMQDKQVELIQLAGQPPRYELSNKEHHHHFVCRSCNKIFELQGCAHQVEDLAPQGFQVEKHEITLFGHCDRCK